MATPAPVQLQQPVTVSDLVCCVFVYGVNLIETSRKDTTVTCTYSPMNEVSSFTAGGSFSGWCVVENELPFQRQRRQQKQEAILE